MKTTIYDQRYQSRDEYWDFKPSSMALKILELQAPQGRRPKVLELGCGEGGTAIFLARNGYRVTAFDLAPTAVAKTKSQAERHQVSIEVFQADINDFRPSENYDVIFSSGTLQYLQPEKRAPLMAALKDRTNPGGLHVLHTFVAKPFVAIAPDAEAQENLWSSGELLMFYRDWRTESFLEEIKPCQSGGVPHEHAHNRLWSRKP